MKSSSKLKSVEFSSMTLEKYTAITKSLGIEFKKRLANQMIPEEFIKDNVCFKFEPFDWMAKDVSEDSRRATDYLSSLLKSVNIKSNSHGLIDINSFECFNVCEFEANVGFPFERIYYHGKLFRKSLGIDF